MAWEKEPWPLLYIHYCLLWLWNFLKLFYSIKLKNYAPLVILILLY